MKKKIIITILGLFVLIIIHISTNIFVFDGGMEIVLFVPLWTGVYSSYTYIMVKRYIGL